MFSEGLVNSAEKGFRRMLPLLGDIGPAVSEYLESRGEEERTLLKYLYGTMPLCDAAEYPPGLFASFAEHALFLREHMGWTKDLPEELFLQDVLYCRINNEDLTDCRRWFYEKLKDRVEGMDPEQAVKEINAWCAGHVTYAASDERTLNPVSVYKSGTGRCGEESVFLVTALRSMGIAARQVYTPRWAHCDDNHAWVEVYVNGGWHFLGACEPEEVLDKGWFTNASSRAMLIHAREFRGPEDGGLGEPGEITGRDGAAVFINDTALYALTSRLMVKVEDLAGDPVAGARVDFELLNMAEYFPVASLYTDGEGKTSVTLGRGSVHLHVSKDGRYAEALADTKAADEVLLRLDLEPGVMTRRQAGTGWRCHDITAPADYPMHPINLTKEQKESGRRRKAQADAARRERADAFLKEGWESRWKDQADLLRGACGNAEEIIRFLETGVEPYREKLLRSLSEKDLKDITAEVLEEHLQKALEVKPFYDGLCAGAPDELFVRYVLNPRIRGEMIQPYRSPILAYFDGARQTEFRGAPEKLWDFLGYCLLPEGEKSYGPLVLSPVAALKSHRGNSLTKKTLFVAVCRTLGIPARINPVDLRAEYYKDGCFVPVSGRKAGQSAPVSQREDSCIGRADGGEEALCELTLRCGPEDHPVYYGNWAIAKLDRGENEEDDATQSASRFRTLDYTGLLWKDGRAALMISPGLYRIITTRRLPGGGQLEAELLLEAGPDQVMSTDLMFRQASTEEMLEDLELDPFVLTDGQGEEREYEALTEGRTTILCFLEEGTEPTEHVLNEMKSHAKELLSSGVNILFAVRADEALDNDTLRSVLRALPHITVCRADFEELVEGLARRMYTDPDKLPLTVLTAPGYRGIYACSGYNVGTVELLLDILKQLGSQE